MIKEGSCKIYKKFLFIEYAKVKEVSYLSIFGYKIFIKVGNKFMIFNLIFGNSND